MKTRRWARFPRRGSASHLASLERRSVPPVRQASFREPARRRGKRISRRDVADGRGVRGFAVATRIPRLPMRFRAAPRVASLAMARFRKPVSPAEHTRRSIAKCVWKRHGVTFPAEGISRRGVANGRGVRCFAVATRIPRLPMRFLATRRVASLAMARFRKPVSPAEQHTFDRIRMRWRSAEARCVYRALVSEG